MKPKDSQLELLPNSRQVAAVIIQDSLSSTYNNLPTQQNQYDIMSQLLKANQHIQTKSFQKTNDKQNSNEAKALVCIRASSKGNSIMEHLEQLKGVNEVHSSTGQYNIIAIAQADNLTKLRKNVMNKIRQIKGIESILTLTIIE